MLRRLLRNSSKDALLVGASLAHGLLLWRLVRPGPVGLFALPQALLLGVMLWWSSNTVSHIHLHSPIFRARVLNRGFALYLSVLLGVPQALWRSRHLWHHGGERKDRSPRRIGPLGVVELGAVGALWLALLFLVPRFFLLVYLPGYLLGMILCKAQGYYEHSGRPVSEIPGVSFYGALYNRLWFNDGYHVEHHRFPGEHWTRLPRRRIAGAAESGWPPVLRFLDSLRLALLTALERSALRPGPIQRFMLRTHARAFSQILPELERRRSLRRVALVGGGLFPRSALILGRLLPRAELTLIDASAAHLQIAHSYLERHAKTVLDRTSFLHAAYAPEPLRDREFDLIVVPLAYVGSRAALYRDSGSAEDSDSAESAEGQSARSGCPVLLVHDWLWRRSPDGGVVISRWLLKRLNVVMRS